MNKGYIWGGLICVILAVMVVASLAYAVNVPHLDDYLLVLDFLTVFDGASSLWNKLHLIFDEANGHRIAFFHLFTVLDHAIFGQTSFFRHIVFINLLYIGCVYLVWKIYNLLNLEIKYFLPLALLLAVPCYAVLNWTSAGMVYCPSVLLALSSFYLLNRKSGWSFYLAVLCAVVASSSSGAGLVIFIAALPFFMERYDRKHLYLWAGVFVLCLIFYFYGYDPSKPGQGLSIFRSPHIALANFVVYYGAYFQSVFGQHYLWIVLSGTGLLMVAAWMFYRYRNEIRKNPVIFSGILLALGYGLSATLMRSSFGLGVTAAYRYRLFQAILPIFLYLAYLKFSKNHKAVFPWILGISILIFGLRWEDNLSMMKDLNSRLSNGLYALQTTKSAAYLPTKSTDRTMATFSQAEQLGIYKLNDIDVHPRVFSGPIKKSRVDPIQFSKAKEENTPDYYLLQGWAYVKYRPAADLDILMRLTSSAHQYYWPSGPLSHPTSLILNAESGFTIVLDKHTKQIEPGTYEMDLVLRHPIKGIVGEQKIDQIFVVN